MENDWLEQDKIEQKNVREKSTYKYGVYNIMVQEVDDTEELEVFRRQWQEELRHDPQQAHEMHHEQKETEVSMVSVILACLQIELCIVSDKVQL